MHRIEIRPLAARDSLEALTQLLHRAYAPLAAAGMNFTAATQKADTTARRAAEGQCFVAEQQGQIVGTVTACGPYAALDAEVESDRARLRARLLEGGLAWLPMLEVWPESRLQGRIEYRRLNGEAVSLPFAPTLVHVFNHGTHHRGQITAALTAMGRAGPELDLVIMLQQEAKAA